MWDYNYLFCYVASPYIMKFLFQDGHVEVARLLLDHGAQVCFLFISMFFLINNWKYKNKIKKIENKN